MSRADEFREYAVWVSDHSWLYERLSRAIAADDVLLELVDCTPETQPAPNMVLGAVHDLLLDGADHAPNDSGHALADFYRTRTDDPLDPRETDPFPAFREFCLAHEGAIAERLETRLVQTNAVGRSALLYPAFARVAARDGGPLALVELGSSAGLNLRWNRYRYEYDGRVVGRPDSSVAVETALRGEADPPTPTLPPAVVSRVGVDLNPLDVTDADDVRWLRALVLPCQEHRHERLAAALEAASVDPPEVREADALEALPDLLADAPADATLVVFSTITLYQFPDETVAAIRETLADHSGERPVHWLSGDPEADVTTPTYRHVRFADGAAESSRIAEFEAYGSWLRWLAE